MKHLFITKATPAKPSMSVDDALKLIATLPKQIGDDTMFDERYEWGKHNKRAAQKLMAELSEPKPQQPEGYLLGYPCVITDKKGTQ